MTTTSQTSLRPNAGVSRWAPTKGEPNDKTGPDTTTRRWEGRHDEEEGGENTTRRKGRGKYEKEERGNDMTTGEDEEEREATKRREK